MILIKIHPAYRMVVAVCDRDLIGQKFEDDNKQLDLTGEFFRGEEKPESEIKDILRCAEKEDATFNFVGRKSCSLGRELGIISEEGIGFIQGVPVALGLL